MTIDEMAEQFKTMKELRQYSQSQQLAIQQLSKRVSELEEENKQLLKELEFPNQNKPTTSSLNEAIKDLPDEMVACITQIRRLKDNALDSELSFEEARKLDIYTKLLQTLRAGQTKEEVNPAKELSDADLDKLLEGN